MRTLKDFLRWYNNRDVVRTLEAVQKMADFYHKKGADMLKLGYNLRSCRHLCSQVNYCKVTESENDLLRKYVKTWSVGHLLNLQGKLLWTILFSGFDKFAQKFAIRLLPLIHTFSRTLMLVEMTLVRL